MLTHMVSFKYRADVPQEVRRDHRERLAGLRTLDGVVDLKVGADVVGSARSFGVIDLMIAVVRSTSRSSMK